jgi:parallel beta-helix repeat protein
MAKQTFTATGSIEQTPEGGFIMSLEATPDKQPVPPDPPEPIDATVITPTGGDDSGLIQDALDNLPDGETLMLSGMFNVGSTIWLEGDGKTICGDPAKPSGFHLLNAGMTGHYGGFLCTKPGNNLTIRGLEFDADNNSVELVFFDGGTNGVIEDCYLHDVPVGPNTCACIHSQNTVGLRVRRNRVERTGGVAGAEGIRGIWIAAREDTIIEGNQVSDTGHTGITWQGDGACTMRDNVVTNSLVQGTAYKFHYTGSSNPELQFVNNKADGTQGGGVMLEQCHLPLVNIDNNEFVNCGEAGTTFGALYTSTDATNVRFTNNRLAGCKGMAAALYLRGALFENNTVASGSNLVDLQTDCHDIELKNSGEVNVGSNCSNVTVDGRQVA